MCKTRMKATPASMCWQVGLTPPLSALPYSSSHFKTSISLIETHSTQAEKPEYRAACLILLKFFLGGRIEEKEWEQTRRRFPSTSRTTRPWGRSVWRKKPCSATRPSMLNPTLWDTMNSGGIPPRPKGCSGRDLRYCSVFFHSSTQVEFR